MDVRVCKCDPGGTVSVQGPDFGGTFGRGAQVDFDAAVAVGAKQTWGQALERYAHLFESPAAAEGTTRAGAARKAMTPPAGAGDSPEKE